MTTTYFNGFGGEGYFEETPLQGVELVHRHYRGDVPRGWEPEEYYYIRIAGYGPIDITKEQYEAIRQACDPADPELEA